MRLRANTITWLRWVFGGLGVVGLWNDFPRLVRVLTPAITENINYFPVFIVVLGIWIGVMFVSYRFLTRFFRVLLVLLIFVSLLLIIFGLFFVNNIPGSETVGVYGKILLDLCLIASIVDPQFFMSKKICS